MPDMCATPALRGFNLSVADVGDQMHLCSPLLSFKGDTSLYVARRLDWRGCRADLASTDTSEASALGTVFPAGSKRTIAPGEGVVAAGLKFAQAAENAAIGLDGPEVAFKKLPDLGIWTGTAAPAVFESLRARLSDEARTAFDSELGNAARSGRPLSKRGDAALLLLRRCGPHRREADAIRQLAGALQNRNMELHRRLLARFEIELGARQDDLREKTARHMKMA